MTLPFFGVTVGTKGPALNPKVLQDMQELGMGNGKGLLRFQIPWSLVEPARGQYNWSLWDDAISKCNQATIKICLTIKQPPAFWLENGYPSPQGTLQIAREMVKRYGSKLDVLDVGNEDYDRNKEIHFAELARTLKVVYSEVKQLRPDIIIWPGALLQRNLEKQRLKLEQLWQGAPLCFDAIAIHPYTGLPDGAKVDPADETQGNIPGFRRCIQQVKEVNASFGHPDVPVVVTEFGFAVSSNFGRPAWQVVSEQEQWQYLQYCYTEALRLGVDHMSLFTLAYASPDPEGMSLVQREDRKTLAYHMVKQFVASHPTGGDPDPDPGGGGGLTPEQLAQVRAHLQTAQTQIQSALSLLPTQSS